MLGDGLRLQAGRATRDSRVHQYRQLPESLYTFFERELVLDESQFAFKLFLKSLQVVHFEESKQAAD